MEEDILKLIRQYLLFPFPQICRHLFVLDLLNLLEKHGTRVNPELVRAVTQADDCTALALEDV